MGTYKWHFRLYSFCRDSNSMIKAYVAHDGSKIFIALHLITGWFFRSRVIQSYPELKIRKKQIHDFEQP